MKEITSKEMTVENMVESLAKYKLDLNFLYGLDKVNKFKLVNWNQIIGDLLNEYFCELTIYNIPKYNDIKTEYCILNYFNELYKEIWVDNLIQISFNNLYPNIICKLLKDDKIKFSIKEFGNLFTFLTDNYSKINEYNIPKEIKLLWNIILNFTYGGMKNESCIIHMDQLFNYDVTKYKIIDGKRVVEDLIPFYTKGLFQKLQLKYPETIIYIEIDEIYLKGKSGQDYLNKLDIF